MLILFWILNFAISSFNAWGCGKTWSHTKYVKGIPHFMNWMGAIMSAMGFTWCYLVLLSFFGSLPIIENAQHVKEPLLTATQIINFANLGYLVIIFPTLGSGLALTLAMWKQFWERHTFANGAVAAYDTFAMVYNIGTACQAVPNAGSKVLALFKDSDKKQELLLLF